ncbi:GNAT family protein [Clostridium sp. AL.422]|uniref:GNAT family N-acetyltransferase n=1 Tax=Clostridium TaxID=1485 RepID=UPI00293DCE8F|nr:MULTISPECIES: GNAT family protein [unclassified Clostridium]MDV4151902.1 GNAT family protein [Clostridium sp. AL.422]
MDIYLRSLEIKDLDEYWEVGFERPDKDVNYYTGTTNNPSKEEIQKFIEKSSSDEERKHFLICNNKDEIIGEIVLIDIDEEYKSCSYRIALFSKKYFNKGIGYKATKEVLKYAFKNLGLHRVELEVFDYNPRAKAMYEKCGFREEGIKRDALFINDKFYNVHIMSILSGEFMED